MTAASANKVTVPGDNRLDELKLGNKTPFWHKIPIIKELRVAVGWQKGMLITGLVLTAFFLLVAIFAPLIAPYSYAQLKGADGVSFPAQAAPSSEHIWGTTAGGYDVFSRVVWGARTGRLGRAAGAVLAIAPSSLAPFELENHMVIGILVASGQASPRLAGDLQHAIGIGINVERIFVLSIPGPGVESFQSVFQEINRAVCGGERFLRGCRRTKEVATHSDGHE